MGNYFEMESASQEPVGPSVCVQGITDHQNVRGVHVELYGSPVTLFML